MATEGTEPTGDISPEQERNAPTYPDVRMGQIASSLNIRIYGIPITDDGKLDGYISMVFCGFQIEGYEHRDCSNRIWHVPESQILSSGVVEDFVCDGNDVRFFDV